MSKIILGDCLEVMRGLEDNQFDLVLTDPPYGINYDTVYSNKPNSVKFSKIENDNKSESIRFLKL